MSFAAADGENDPPNGGGSSQFSKETKRYIGESAEKQPASKPNHNIQQLVLFDCGILHSSHTATGGAGGLMFPPRNATTHTSELTQTMQQASMAQPPSSTNAAPVFANESSADGNGGLRGGGKLHDQI